MVISGQLKLNKQLDKVTHQFLKNFWTTRRESYSNVAEKFGAEGEFYCGTTNKESSQCTPPSTQPSLWCWWATDGKYIIFAKTDEAIYYPFVEWIEYLISKVLAPRGYSINGFTRIHFGESKKIDIDIIDNDVNKKRLIVDYSINKLLGPPPPTAGVPKIHPTCTPPKKKKKETIAELEMKLKALEISVKKYQVDLQKIVNALGDLLK